MHPPPPRRASRRSGFEGPLTGPVAPLGQEQLHFAQLAVAMDNAANKTQITLVQGDTS